MSRKLSRKVCLGTGVCLVAIAALSTSSAAAAPVYASPLGSNSAACTQIDPCSLSHAIATATDEVIVTPGGSAYAVTSTITVSTGIDIHGEDGQPEPELDPSGTTFGALLINNASAKLRNVQINSSDFEGFSLQAGLVDGVSVSDTGGSATACNIIGDGTTTIRDSICRATAANSHGLGDSSSGVTENVTLRNDTAIGDFYGLDFRDNGGGSVTVDAKNVIAQKTGTTSGSADVHAADLGGSTVAVNLAFSNYATTFTSGTGTVTSPNAASNQNAATKPPVFVSSSDFHEAPTSPTIDAGVTDVSNGTTDIDRESRNQGLGPDIGADEFTDAAPVAGGDSKSIDENAAATPIDVLANDTDSDGGPKAVQSVTQPANGQVAITGSGSGLTYQPNPGYCNNGSPTDDFTYTLNGGSTATVMITVPCSATPVAKDGTPPITTIGKGPKKHTTKHKAKFQFVSNEPGSSFMCKLDKKAFAACSAPKTVRVKTGKHTFKVEAIDPAGNIDPTPAVFHWKVLPK